MPRGISLHVGVNASVAPDLNVQPLEGCENDADEMEALARARNFTTTLLKGNAATFDAVRNQVLAAAQQLQDGDIFLFTFAGHGTKTPRTDNIEQGKDETIVLQDRIMVDNILGRQFWPEFDAGVRVVMVADSCYSGDVLMAPLDFDGDDSLLTTAVSQTHEDSDEGVYRRPPVEPILPEPLGNGSRIRSVPASQAQAHLTEMSDFYSALSATLSATDNPISASVLLLAACGANAATFEEEVNGKTHGIYTRALLDIWGADNSLTYQELTGALQARLTATGPTMMSIGESSSFSNAEAFKI